MDEQLEDRLIQDIKDFLDKYPAAEWGPAHIVLSDYNIEQEYIENAIIEIGYLLSGKKVWDGSVRQPDELLEATKVFLVELLNAI